MRSGCGGVAAGGAVVRPLGALVDGSSRARLLERALLLLRHRPLHPQVESRQLPLQRLRPRAVLRRARHLRRRRDRRRLRLRRCREL
eukprot:6931121-Prymnesium_polylepis.1